MKITEVRIFPVESRDGKLKAFATMTFDDWFVVRNVKVIQGNNGLFVAMPSRKAVDSCPKCRFKNAKGSRYCNQCGAEIGQQMGPVDEKRAVEHMDIAHPIKQDCRMYIQQQVLEAYNKEKDRQEKEGGSYNPPTEEDLGVIIETPEGSEQKEATEAETSSEEESKDIEL
ncbi:MAG: SpoVG family protein [Candidatus Omnitrophota bacterium]